MGLFSGEQGERQAMAAKVRTVSFTMDEVDVARIEAMSAEHTRYTAAPSNRSAFMRFMVSRMWDVFEAEGWAATLKRLRLDEG